MSSSFIRIFLTAFLLICSGFGISSATTPQHVMQDSRSVIVRRAPATEDQQQMNDPDYRYDRVVAPQQMSIWERFLNWLFRKLGRASGTKGGEAGLTVLQYVIIIAAVVAIILLILKNEIRSLFVGKPAAINVDFTEIEEDINTIDFEAMINEAISRKDFRKATRLHFLRLLKQLSDKNLIRWQIDKTNNDYQMELADKSFRKKFAELAKFYEYVWYGDFALTEQMYSENILKFKTFTV